ncbi:MULTISPECIES: PAAR domain-containing protein [unclassified Chromobacterium]|uniref:PAAR domain-containing protein n=1 Tax=unclassified Chromobacterium TaxID=2641838 RepID=UPI000D30526A|nr:MULTISPECIES: PAAR domain-containing protein [unclassified Chromobacterium]PTU63422.1 PAAR domain-containing protein [Chromobacterium sp. Panama]UJB31183.1 PAAR domain-containing protein [Chromobacterium sp. Beijing]
MPGKIIRLGDPTSHGGSVISASGPVVYGKAAARVGDQVSCPQPGHGVSSILPGPTRMSAHGSAFALEGFQAGCGCTLISTLPNAGEV